MYTLNAKRAKEILYEVFPGHSGIDLLSSSLDEELCVNFTCYVHFPKVTIWNDKSETHNIRDLYVKFKIDRGCRITCFEGTRTSLDEIEIGRYNHSHMSQTGFGVWGTFCTGQSFVRACLTNDLENEDSFYAFILSLPNFVEHESLEGKPYKYMSSLRDVARTGGANLESTSFFNDQVSCRSSDGTRYNLLSINYDCPANWAYSLTAEDLEPAINEMMRSFEGTTDLFNISSALYSVVTRASKTIVFNTEGISMLTYLSAAKVKEKSSTAAFRLVNGKIIYKTLGDVVLLKDKNDKGGSDEDVIENPCIFKFPKIGEDLSVTIHEIPAIKYKELVKKYNKNAAASVEFKPSLYNASAAFFKILGFRQLYSRISTQINVEREQSVNNREFLESFL